MKSQQVHVVLLLLGFALSLFLLVAAAKYAEWARVMVVGGQGSWLSLVFYVGAVPLLSLFFITMHLMAMHFDVFPLDPDQQDDQSYFAAKVVLIVSALQFAMWLGQASVCTACELGPILAGQQGNVAAWCPQSRFRDNGRAGLADMLAMLAVLKDCTSWGMVLLSIAMAECARRNWSLVSIQGFERSSGKGSDWKNGFSGGGIEMDDVGKSWAGGSGLQRSATTHYESKV